MSGVFDCADDFERTRGLTRAADVLAAGELVVLPTDTVYGLAADAFSPDAVAGLLAAKGRGRAMPPPVLVPHVRTIDGLATGLSQQARDLAEAFWPGALTVIVRAQPTLNWDLGDTDGTVAVRMPLHPVALQLLERTGPLAVSSANLTGAPAATTCEEARLQLADSVSVYLDGGTSAVGVPSSIVDVTGPVARLVRLGALSVQELRTVVPELAVPPELEPDGAAPAGEGPG